VAKVLRLFLAFIVSVVLGVSSPLAANADNLRLTYIVMPVEGYADQVRSEISSLGEYPEAQLALIDNLLIIDLLPEDAAKLSASPSVAFIELDTPISITDTQTPTPSWGLKVLTLLVRIKPTPIATITEPTLQEQLLEPAMDLRKKLPLFH